MLFSPSLSLSLSPKEKRTHNSSAPHFPIDNSLIIIIIIFPLLWPRSLFDIVANLPSYHYYLYIGSTPRIGNPQPLPNRWSRDRVETEAVSRDVPILDMRIVIWSLRRNDSSRWWVVEFNGPLFACLWLGYFIRFPFIVWILFVSFPYSFSGNT